MESLTDEFGKVPKLSNPDANHLVDTYLQALARIEPEITQLGG